jgi:hypothetical protein
MAQETQQFLSCGSVKRNMLAYSTLWRPNGRGLHSIPLKWSKYQTWVPRLSSLYQYPSCDESTQNGVSHALHNWSKSNP